MKKYGKVLSLDFEMYNSMRYWSICWIGAVCADTELNETGRLDVKLNPGTRHKLIGKELKFPFKYSDLKPLPKFDGCCNKLFELIDEDTLVVGHAIDNDVKMMLAACDYYGVRCPDFDYIDTNAVHCAIAGEFSQLSLSSLASNYNYEFEAHNPVEDAAATLYSLKGMLREKDITLDEIESLGVGIGMVRDGLVRRCTIDCMSERARAHIDNYNAVFDAAVDGKREQTARESEITGRTVKIDGKLRTNQNLYPLIKWAVSAGARAVGESAHADIFLTAEINETHQSSMSLRQFANRFGAPESACEGLDFYPNKVTLKSGEVISYSQYLNRKYASQNSRDAYCFARAVERRYDFEELVAVLLASGGRVCAVPVRRCIFVVDTKDRLNDESDFKIPTFKRLLAKGKAKLQTLSE